MRFLWISSFFLCCYRFKCWPKWFTFSSSLNHCKLLHIIMKYIIFGLPLMDRPHTYVQPGCCCCCWLGVRALRDLFWSFWERWCVAVVQSFRSVHLDTLWWWSYNVPGGWIFKNPTSSSSAPPSLLKLIYIVKIWSRRERNTSSFIRSIPALVVLILKIVDLNTRPVQKSTKYWLISFCTLRCVSFLWFRFTIRNCIRSVTH